MNHFNKLTPSEQERLACLLEELGEVQQAIGKILRHGYESSHPETLEDNRTSLERELGDVLYCVEALCDARDLSEDLIKHYADKKAKSILPFLHHQGNRT